MENRKPILSIDDQIKHLKEKGIKFELINEENAKDYLWNHNNYFKLTAYRKNFDKHPDGINKDKYIDLDFAYLEDLAVIDMNLRYQIVRMALDIEHHVKLRILRRVVENNEDGYEIIKDYVSSLEEDQKSIFENEIGRNKNNIYCGNIVDKYQDAYPVWVLVEIIPFGRLVDFYGFCADRFHDKKMKDEYYMLWTCKDIRNACAHSSCILNDLDSGTIIHGTNRYVTNELVKIKGMRSNFRRNRMSNARIQQIVTLLYVYKIFMIDKNIRLSECENLHRFIKRAFENKEYYKKNVKISSTFNFLKMVVDSWFPNIVP